MSDVHNYGLILIINNSTYLETLIFCYTKYISEGHHGLFKGNSTIMNLFCVTEFIPKSIDDGFQT